MALEVFDNDILLFACYINSDDMRIKRFIFQRVGKFIVSQRNHLGLFAGAVNDGGY